MQVEAQLRFIQFRHDILRHNNHIPTVLIAMMFFAVVYRGPSLPGEVREWFSVFFEISLSMVLAAVIWNYNKWVASFLLLVRVMMFYPHYGPMSYYAGQAVFNGCLWYLFVVMFFSVQNLNTLYRGMRILTYFHVPIAVLQVLGVAGILSVPQPTGLMANPLELSALLLFCLPAFLVLRGKKVWPIAIPIAGIFIAGQSLGVLCLLAGASFYVAVKYNMYSPAIVLTSIVLGVCAFRDLIPMIFDRPGNELSVSILNRLYVWKLGFKAWLQHPLGAGIGHWKIVFDRPMAIDGRRWVTAHNEFLQMLFELGIGSAVLFIGYGISTAKKAAKKAVIPLTALIIIIAYSAASFPLHIAPTAMVAVTWIGVLTIYERDNSANNRGYPGFGRGLDA